MARKETSIENTISGMVIPIEWDDYDDITRVAIQTSDEKEYLVDRNKKGKELLELIEEEVEATGVVREDGDSNYIIKVNEYSVL